MTELGDALAGLTAAPVPETPERRVSVAPKGWEAGVCYDPSGAMTVTTTAADNVHGDPQAWHRLIADLGLTVPDGWQVRLVEALGMLRMAEDIVIRAAMGEIDDDDEEDE